MWMHKLTEHQFGDTLRRVIQRKLVSGRLPYDSAPTLHGGPGAGGTCDACDRPLLAKQLVMAVPLNGHFVQLHGNCFMLWDSVRRFPHPRSSDDMEMLREDWARWPLAAV